MCLFTTYLENPKYKPNKKNGYFPPKYPLINGKEDTRISKVPIKCGKCFECMKRNRRDWQVRLYEEIKDNRNGIFVTLTFSDESIKDLDKLCTKKGYDRDNEIATIGVHRFLERWRKATGKSVRHWLVTELGHKGTENIHLHGIIWTDKDSEFINKTWKYGFTWLSIENKGYVNERTINYITKYISKNDEVHKWYKPKILCSHGIGKGYINRWNARQNKYKGKFTKDYYENEQGYKFALPIYYRNKIYSEEEKELLWLQKLDRLTRYVDGVEISIKNGFEQFNNAIKHARIKNKFLRYTDYTKDWQFINQEIKAEQTKRELLRETRIKRAIAKG